MLEHGAHGGRGAAGIPRRAARPAARPRQLPELPRRLVAAAVQQLLAAGVGALDADVRQQRLLQGGHHLGEQLTQAARAPAATGARGGEGEVRAAGGPGEAAESRSGGKRQ